MKLTLKNYTLTTTVGELIKKLQEFDVDALVFTEGCDCIGNAVNVTNDKSDGSVLIERDDYPFDYNDVLKDEYKGRLISNNQNEEDK